MKKYFYILGIMLMSFTLLTGCAGVKVQRTETDEVIDLSGNWNDADSQITAKDLINQCINHPWRDEFLVENGKKPDVIVGTIKNKSQEHINVETFIKDLETELVNSGKITFVASKTERMEIREEKNDQATYSSEETKKAQYQESGADFMLRGQINTVFDEIGRKSVKYYQIELEMVNILTHQKIWIGQKKIKKFVKRKKFGL